MKLDTVGELIAKLQTFDPNMLWGVCGHYGELHVMNTGNVICAETFIIDSDKWLKGEEQEVIAAVMFDYIDIGEEPD